MRHTRRRFWCKRKASEQPDILERYGEFDRARWSVFLVLMTWQKSSERVNECFSFYLDICLPTFLAWLLRQSCACREAAPAVAIVSPRVSFCHLLSIVQKALMPIIRVETEGARCRTGEGLGDFKMNGARCKGRTGMHFLPRSSSGAAFGCNPWRQEDGSFEKARPRKSYSRVRTMPDKWDKLNERMM